MFKLKYLFILLTLTFAGFSACTKAPKYPKEPIIKFNSLKKYTYRSGNTNGFIDSLVIKIDFTDGDGDLGLTTEDQNVEPYIERFNYICDLYIKEGNEFVLKDFPDINLSGNFEPLIEKGYKGPLEGTLERSIVIQHLNPSLPPNTAVKFRVKIYDRALNPSNEIFTSEITLKEQ